ncbi:hypothetical protein C8J56DRAFT_901748, partial [Mycena floridula]
MGASKRKKADTFDDDGSVDEYYVPKKRKATKAAVDTEWFATSEKAASKPTMAPSSSSLPAATSSKPAAAVPEKRAARYKPKCPQNILERVSRVIFFMIERERDKEQLSEEFKVLGSTGNVYTVTICQTPSCTCPDAMKGNHCKHIPCMSLNLLPIGIK